MDLVLIISSINILISTLHWKADCSKRGFVDYSFIYFDVEGTERIPRKLH